MKNLIRSIAHLYYTLLQDTHSQCSRTCKLLSQNIFSANYKSILHWDKTNASFKYVIIIMMNVWVMVMYNYLFVTKTILQISFFGRLNRPNNKIVHIICKSNDRYFEMMRINENTFMHEIEITNRIPKTNSKRFAIFLIFCFTTKKSSSKIQNIRH